ncbi:MAG: UpxY family transcription antiterminator [Bacteroidales bacterium]|nr:UpxY family transcription antiterminator [Bacteroidales bacterium]
MQSNTPIKSWYAIYTRSRTEKQTHKLLLKAGIDTYLPLIRVLKQWSDRKKWVEEPLFRSYIFVCITQAEYYDVLNTPGSVRFISFEGKAVAIPPQQIEAIRQYVDTGQELPDVELDLSPGTMVDIIAGPMRGISGELLEIMGKKKVRIEIDGLGQAVYLELPASHIKGVRC